jgi:hypothetical protein
MSPRLAVPRLAVPLLAFAVAAAAGCSSTRVAAVYRSPDHQGALTKILVGVRGASEPRWRESAEDALVARLAPGTAVAAYRVIPPEAEKDPEALRALLKEKGFDGALVARILDTGQDLTTSHMATPVTVYGYYGWADTALYDTQAADVRQVLRVEARLYDLSVEEPIWAAVTETLDPTSRVDARAAIADAIVDKLRAAKLLSDGR